MVKHVRQLIKDALETAGTVRDIDQKLANLSTSRDNDYQTLLDVNQRVLAIRQVVPTLYVDSNTVIVKLFTDLKMYLDPRDMAVAAHIALDGIWEKDITRAWLTLLQPEMTVLDIGANFGYFGLMAGQFTDRKKANIVMFEANPDIIPYVNKSISMNWFNETVKIENFAISNASGKAKLTVLDDYIGSSSVKTINELDSYMHDKMQLKVNREIEVDSISVDKYCKTNNIHSVDLIKMDIEGYEEVAYEGMRKIIHNSPNVSMFIEFTKDGYKDPKAFYEKMLQDFGNVYTIDESGAIKKPKDTAYESIVNEKISWVMPIFSKDKSLHTKKNTIIS